MADQQMQFKILFDADIKKARQSIQELQKQLTNIQIKPPVLFDDVQIKAASKAATELQHNLQRAVNVDTGKIDLSKFAIGLKQSGKTLTQYRTELAKIGPEGNQVFLSLASNIAAAEVPTVRLNKVAHELFVTFKNTAKWMISSSFLHGMVGAFQSAYSYAQSLDKSLNNIRIVTSQSTDQMAKFAQEANKAAQSLSTSTLNYSNAALIYYQQGLSDQEVKERTDATVKMANVTRQTSEQVSQQMTAIWNNYAKGGEKLEYFADVLTALGAATASSSAEISEGLEKFAAIGETVGLSYEYASAALATVTATTRQSADIVGNSFKTLFGRLESLKLGETLEDDTTLGKYSQALEAVGINIKSTSGDLKDMDDILDELGAKWNTLGKDQQVALAQTVGGVRQYTQLIALMNNWDFFKKNVNIAKNSEGTLEEQQKIYEESWEASAKRVKAAWEELYQDILNSDFFIGLNDILAKVINGVDSITKSLGGLKGILLGVSAIFLNKFSKNIPNALQETSRNIQLLFGGGTKEADTVYSQAKESLEKFDTSGLSGAQKQELENTKTILNLKHKISLESEHMSKAEKEIAEQMIEQKRMQAEFLVDQQKEIDNLEVEIKKYGQDVLAKSIIFNKDKNQNDYNKFANKNQNVIDYLDRLNQLENYSKLDISSKVKEFKIDFDSNNKDSVKNMHKMVSNYLDELEAEDYITDDQNADIFNKFAKSDNFNYLTRKIKESLSLPLDFGGLELPVKFNEEDIQKAKDDLAEIYNISEEEIKEFNSKKEALINISNITEAREKVDKFANQYKALKLLSTQYENLQDKTKIWDKEEKDLKEVQEEAKKYLKYLKEINQLSESDEKKFIEKLNNTKSNKEVSNLFNEEVARSLYQKDNTGNKFSNGQLNINDEYLGEFQNNFAKEIGVTTSEVDNLTLKINDDVDAINNYKATLAGWNQEEEQSKTTLVSLSENIGLITSGLFGLGQLLSSMTRISDVINDEDASSLEKIIALTSAASMGLMSLKSILGAVNGVMGIANTLNAIHSATKTSLIGLLKKERQEKIKNMTVEEIQQKLNDEGIKKERAAAIAKAAKWLCDNPATLAIGLSLLAVGVGGAIAAGISSHNNKVQKEQNKKELEEVSKRKETSSEEISSNKELLTSMKNELDIYKKTGENKEKLDQITQQLAKSLGIEGSAIAVLSGEYADYQKILETANKAQETSLKNRLVLLSKENELSEKLLEGSFKFSGEFASGHSSLVKGLKEAGIESINTTTSTYAGTQSYKINYDELSENELIKLYNFAQEQYERVLTGEYNEEYGSAEDIKKLYLSLPSELEQIKNNLLEIATIEGQTKIFGNFKASDLENYDQYERWLKDFKEEYKDQYSDSQINEIVDSIAEASFNDKIKDFNNIAKAVEEINKQAKGLNEDKILQLQNKIKDINSGYNANLVGLVNWSTVTNENFDKMIELANNYANSLQKVKDIENELTKLQELEAIAKKNNADITEDEIKTLIENGIDLNKFFSQSSEQRMASIYSQEGELRNQNLDALLESQKANETRKKYLEDEIKRLQERNKEIPHELGGFQGLNEYKNNKELINNLLEEYTNLKTEIENYPIKLNFTINQVKTFKEVRALWDKLDKEQVKRANNNVVEYQAKKYGLDEKTVKARALDKIAEGYGDTETAAYEAAIQIERTNKGLQDLYNNSENLTNLDLSKKDSNYWENIGKIKESLANVFNVEEEDIGNSFIEKEWNNIIALSEGKVEYLKVLHDDFIDYFLENPIINGENIFANLDTASTKFQDWLQQLKDVLQDDSINLGDSIDNKSFIFKCNEMMRMAGITADQVNAFFNKIGYTVETEEITRPLIIKGRLGKDNAHVADELGNTEITVPQIKFIAKGYNSDTSNYTPKSPKGGGSSKQNKEKKDLNLDRYWNINNAIKRTSNALDKYNRQLQKLQTMQEHLFGQELIDNLKKQNALINWRNKLLEQQKSNYEKLYAEQQKELKELEWKLKKVGGTFKGDILTDYAKVLKDAYAKEEKARLAYNKSKTDANEKAYENAVKERERIQELIDRYRELYYDEIADTQQKLDEAAQQQLENRLKILANNLQIWSTEIQIKLDLNEAKRNLNDFLKQIQQDFRKVFSDLTIDSGFDKKNFDTYKEDIATTIQAIADVEAEIDKINAGDESDKFASVSEAEEKLKELQQQLIDQGNNLNQLYQQVWQTYLDGLNQVKDKFDTIIQQYERINDELEYEKQLVELIYGDKAFDLMDKYYNTQSNRINSQIESLKTQVGFWEQEFQKSYEMNKEHGVMLDDMTTWTEDMKVAYENMQTAQSDLNNLILEGVKNLQEDYLNSINKVFDTMDKNIWGMSFDKMKEDWDHIQNLAGEYLDDVEGAYQIQTLANKIDESIASTLDLKAQQKLKDLREQEINMLREKDHLTKDDIELAEARYQIALKEIALEESMNNKNSMKLARDENGNWTYQYVADEGDNAKKRQELLDSYNDLYEKADNAYNHAMELAMNTYQEMQEKMREIAEDMTLSEEEKMAKIQEINEKYTNEMNAAVGNSELYRQEAMTASASVFSFVCETEEKAYESLTDKQKQLVDSMKDQTLHDYEQIRSAIVDGLYPDIAATARSAFEETNMNSMTVAANMIETWAKDNGTSVRGMMRMALNDIKVATENYAKALDELQTKAGVVFSALDQMLTDTNTKTEGLTGTTEKMTEEASKYIEQLRQAVASVGDEWDRVIQAIQTAINKLKEYLGGQKEEEQQTNQDNNNNTDDNNGDSEDNNGGNTGGGSGNNVVTKKTPKVGDVTTLEWGAYTRDQNGSKPWGTERLHTKGGVQIDMVGGLDGTPKYGDWYVHIRSADGKFGDLGWVKPNQLTGYDTGGYTGEWGSSGKVALLHQKEIVLNAHDTANLLNTISMVRDITSLSDSLESAVASSISKIAMGIVAGTGSSINSSKNTNTDNNFYITAEFPDANDVNSIREAILSLPNLADQYLHQN